MEGKRRDGIKVDEIKFRLRHQLQHGGPWASSPKQTNSVFRVPDVSLPKLFLFSIFSKLLIICDYFLKASLFKKKYPLEIMEQVKEESII